MQTSNFARAKRLSPDLRPVGIAVRPPRWFVGEHEPRLAPTAAMLRMPLAQYNELFDGILAKLDPEQFYRELGENSVLLCWEPPGFSCHRRRVAEWFETHLGVEVTEFGFDRADCPAYADLPLQEKRAR